MGDWFGLFCVAVLGYVMGRAMGPGLVWKRAGAAAAAVAALVFSAGGNRWALIAGLAGAALVLGISAVNRPIEKID